MKHWRRYEERLKKFAPQVSFHKLNLCRSGVEPPTEKLHPRESRGAADGKQESIKRFISGDVFPDLGLREIFGGGGSFRSGVQPPTGSDSFAPQASFHKLNLRRSGVEPPTGKLHPRESRGAADGKQESIKRFISGGCLSRFGIAGNIWRGWIVPVGGSTPDRLRIFRAASFISQT